MENLLRQDLSPIEKVQAAIDSIAKFQQKITALDMAGWTDVDKINFQAAMTHLKTDIDNTIAAMAAPEPTTTDAPPAG